MISDEIYNKEIEQRDQITGSLLNQDLDFKQLYEMLVTAQSARDRYESMLNVIRNKINHAFAVHMLKNPDVICLKTVKEKELMVTAMLKKEYEMKAKLKEMYQLYNTLAEHINIKMIYTEERSAK